MNTPSITVATQNQRRMRGFALISVVVALMLTLLLEALDQTIVGTVMPRIIAQLQGLDRYSWVVTAYILASMTMIPIVGKFSDPPISQETPEPEPAGSRCAALISWEPSSVLLPPSV
jgi:MFS family permease